MTMQDMTLIELMGFSDQIINYSVNLMCDTILVLNESKGGVASFDVV